jgi:hypothetical protein
MKRSLIALRMLLSVVVSIGIGMIVIGFVKDADLVTFLGVFLVMVPFTVGLYVETIGKYRRSPDDVGHRGNSNMRDMN